jgi:non-specific serine/threonine protein kinase
MLLILDNLEHRTDAVSLVEALLNGCPRMTIMVTSRSVLYLYGEHDFPVPSLSVPALTDPLDTSSVLELDAVALFVERARAVKPDFALSNENVPAVVEICRHLDGLPLAIELAAARIRILTPQAIASRLSSSFRLLTSGAGNLPARQDTLRGTIDWSYGLLSSEEQLLFVRLAVFAGGFTLEAAEDVCNLDGDLTMEILDGVTSLVDKSPVQAQQGMGGEARFGGALGSYWFLRDAIPRGTRMAGRAVGAD